jgi:hypothetical protein
MADQAHLILIQAAQLLMLLALVAVETPLEMAQQTFQVTAQQATQMVKMAQQIVAVVAVDHEIQAAQVVTVETDHQVL